jgi:hypothetical protein
MALSLRWAECFSFLRWIAPQALAFKGPRSLSVALQRPMPRFRVWSAALRPTSLFFLSAPPPKLSLPFVTLPIRAETFRFFRSLQMQPRISLSAVLLGTRETNSLHLHRTQIALLLPLEFSKTSSRAFVRVRFPFRALLWTHLGDVILSVAILPSFFASQPFLFPPLISFAVSPFEIWFLE